jgi:mRNA interferase MazF
MVNRGQIWWAELAEPVASEPGYKRPVIIVQADEFNKSRINTVVVIAITSNLRLAAAPGNVRLSKAKTGLSKESVANVSQIITLDKQFLVEKIGELDNSTMQELDEGVTLVLGL